VENNALVAGLYATFKATDKLSISARGEYVYEEQNTVYPSASHTGNADGFELTGTVEYDLWANVISRLEVRWDHASHHDYMPIAGETDYGTAVGFYANVIYKF
jgi:opacity protein-like surface antigen